MKSQRYRTTNYKFWKHYNKKCLLHIIREVENIKNACYHLDFLKVRLIALYKCWLGFVIDKEKWEWDKIEIYAKPIQHLEKDLNRGN